MPVPGDRVVISGPDARLILISAFRYALGRRTYMPGVVVGVIKDQWLNLSPHDRSQIQGDIRHAIECNMAGDDCDVDVWRKLLELDTYQ